MRIGIDTSGKFSTGPGFESTVVAAAVGTDAAFAQVAAWTVAALDRWGLSEKLDELHAKELWAPKRLEVCQMLADRGDIQLAAIATDPGLLGSSEAVSRHRSRQRERAREMRPRTAEGRRRRDALLHLLNDEALHDDEYLLAACLPLVLSDIAQRAFAFFAHDEHRTDMEGFVVRIDEEAAPTMRYSDASLLPTLGGDSRFSFRFPTSWRDGAVHPLLARILHPDGDGVMPQELFNDVDWASSQEHPAIQIADVAAWVLARRMNKPAETDTAECFQLLQPLLAGEDGQTVRLFSIPPLREDQRAMYQHLAAEAQPPWWLMPVSADPSPPS